jgi:hypothetical protein
MRNVVPYHQGQPPRSFLWLEQKRITGGSATTGGFPSLLVRPNLQTGFHRDGIILSSIVSNDLGDKELLGRVESVMLQSRLLPNNIQEYMMMDS